MRRKYLYDQGQITYGPLMALKLQCMALNPTTHVAHPIFIRAIQSYWTAKERQFEREGCIALRIGV